MKKEINFKKFVLVAGLSLGILGSGIYASEGKAFASTDSIKTETTTTTTSTVTKNAVKYKLVKVTESKIYTSGKIVTTEKSTFTPVVKSSTDKATTSIKTTTKNSNKVVSTSNQSNVIKVNGKKIATVKFADLSKQAVSTNLQSKIEGQVMNFASGIVSESYKNAIKKNPKVKYSANASYYVSYRKNNTISIVTTVKVPESNYSSQMSLTFNTKTDKALTFRNMFSTKKQYNAYMKVINKDLTKKYGSTLPLDMTVWHFNEKGQLIIRLNSYMFSNIKTPVDIVVPNKYLIYVK